MFQTQKLQMTDVCIKKKVHVSFPMSNTIMSSTDFLLCVKGTHASF